MMAQPDWLIERTTLLNEIDKRDLLIAEIEVGFSSVLAAGERYVASLIAELEKQRHIIECLRLQNTSRKVESISEESSSLADASSARRSLELKIVDESTRADKVITDSADGQFIIGPEPLHRKRVQSSIASKVSPFRGKDMQLVCAELDERTYALSEAEATIRNLKAEVTLQHIQLAELKSSSASMESDLNAAEARAPEPVASLTSLERCDVVEEHTTSISISAAGDGGGHGATGGEAMMLPRYTSESNSLLAQCRDKDVKWQEYLDLHYKVNHETEVKVVALEKQVETLIASLASSKSEIKCHQEVEREQNKKVVAAHKSLVAATVRNKKLSETLAKVKEEFEGRVSELQREIANLRCAVTGQPGVSSLKVVTGALSELHTMRRDAPEPSCYCARESSPSSIVSISKSTASISSLSSSSPSDTPRLSPSLASPDTNISNIPASMARRLLVLNDVITKRHEQMMVEYSDSTVSCHVKRGKGSLEHALLSVELKRRDEEMNAMQAEFSDRMMCVETEFTSLISEYEHYGNRMKEELRVRELVIANCAACSHELNKACMMMTRKGKVMRYMAGVG